MEHGVAIPTPARPVVPAGVGQGRRRRRVVSKARAVVCSPEATMLILQRRASFDRRRGVWNETGVSFAHRTTAVLLRCLREKGVEVTPESTRDARRLAVDTPRSGISHHEEHTRPAIRPRAGKQIDAYGRLSAPRLPRRAV